MAKKILNFDVIIQARIGSSRLRGKVLKKISNIPVLEILMKRLKKSKLISRIIIATTKKKEDDKIVNFCRKKNYLYFRGPESNVLKRYFLTASHFNCKNIVRITADCPLIEAKMIDNMILKFRSEKKIHYLSNINPPSYPDGFDIEIFTFFILSYFNKKKVNNYEKEHVTICMKKSRFKKKNISYKKDLSNIRLTLDYKKDLFQLKKIIKYFDNNIYISSKKILELVNNKKKFKSVINN